MPAQNHLVEDGVRRIRNGGDGGVEKIEPDPRGMDEEERLQ